MEKEKKYEKTRFSAHVIREASEEFRRQVDPRAKTKPSYYFSVEADGAKWHHDSAEEVFADYRRSSGDAAYREERNSACLHLIAVHSIGTTVVTVEAPDRAQIEAVFEVFEKHLGASRLPSPSEPEPEPVRKEKSYKQTRFSADVIREASNEFRRQVDPSGKSEPRYRFWVVIDAARWHHGSPDEFFAEYRRGSEGAHYGERREKAELDVTVVDTGTSVEVEAPNRSLIEAVFEVFEKHLADSRLPTPPEAAPSEPTVFIGHGRSTLWQELKDHLQDKHGYSIQAYEIGARAGHAIRDTLNEMLKSSSFAILVMTGEDETAEGGLRPRQNVVHEAGLFQGRLGFNRAIVLFEEGTEAFWNIDGIGQIRFSRGNIKETFGEVLATLRREFHEDAA